MSEKTTRRNFLKTATAGAAALSLSAASYARVAGANDRLSIGIIGCGGRGRGAHMTGVRPFIDSQNVEITAVCDPWRIAREEAAAMTKDWFGREARQFGTYRDVVALDDIDAVMIASCDHQHTTHLEAAARAKKDVYVEKPLSMDLESLKRACDAVKENNVVVQVGTQLRSMPSMTGAREVFKTGVLGTVGRIEQHRNGWRPYWYAYIKEDVKEEDLDWAEFLMDRPMRPFHPVTYSGWYGYRDFSDGAVPGFGSHYIDLIHYITGAQFPASAVCLGGTYTWKDQHQFTCPDHVTALWTYPEGFMVEYTTNFGNDSGSSFKIFGDTAVMDLQDWSNPYLLPDGVHAKDPAVKEKTAIENIERPDHVLDWLQCIRSRQTPNASIDAGYQHAVAVIMAMMAYDAGKRMIYDHEKREIREG
ncbi:MAG: Gfo/Idh/MocA family oxidoreductase [Candidatus Hydrogenedentes bacterium]|nr:Gfo/Idh/MocA family oxidoreductase [Candidatus Hydrogenedentota bacterium]